MGTKTDKYFLSFKIFKGETEIDTRQAPTGGRF